MLLKSSTAPRVLKYKLICINTTQVFLVSRTLYAEILLGKFYDNINIYYHHQVKKERRVWSQA